MPLRDVSQTSAPRGLVVAACGNCHQADRVRAVDVDDVSPGVQYWRCDGCGFIWATRDDEDLRAARAS
jgi:MinD superfamily P-loop ATPase